jgi:hypothetical protein
MRDEEDKSYVRGRIACVRLSVSYDQGNLLITSAGLSRKIPANQVFLAVLTLSTKASGAKPPTFEQRPDFLVPSAEMTCSP